MTLCLKGLSSAVTLPSGSRAHSCPSPVRALMPQARLVAPAPRLSFLQLPPRPPETSKPWKPVVPGEPSANSGTLPAQIHCLSSDASHGTATPLWAATTRVHT